MLLSERFEAKGRAEARAEGWIEGWVEGWIEGRVEEARHLLSRQLRRRFPGVAPELLKRLDDAPLEDLERWAEAVVVADTPGQVFDA
jgi:hypothetical protein